MVSTLHGGEESIVRERRCPRVTSLIKKHVMEVWGDNHTREIKIPSVIDDYNHWMLGVDKSDQFIAYYRPQLRVRRYWMAIFFHCLDIIRINAFIVYRFTLNLYVSNQPTLTHKMFLCEFISSLLGRAASKIHGRTRKAGAKSRPLLSPVSKKPRMSQNNPELPPERWNGKLEEHVVGMDP